MAGPRRLVLFVEGEGDALALPVLVKHLLTEQAAWDCLFLDPDPFRVGGIHALTGNKQQEWKKKLAAAAKRSRLGGVLLVLDGDADKVEGKSFCATTVARLLSARARDVGAGTRFSVATVFSCMEYESWLLAGLEVLAGKPLPDSRPGVKAGQRAPEGDLEKAPRDAKKRLSECMESGYKETLDQEPLTKLLIEDLKPVRDRGLRSFRRLESAIAQLVEALRSDKHIVTPEDPET
ncbi:MAG: DUF4276 family protein [Gemmataceae bacterium]|nr:DUF4276 family protein [Gemmataceae bacterium]